MLVPNQLAPACCSACRLCRRSVPRALVYYPLFRYFVASAQFSVLLLLRLPSFDQ